MSKSILLLLLPVAIFAGPSGEKVVHGTAKIERHGSHILEVTQGSARAIVEWDQFSLSGDEVARFVQPGADSAILNRVVGGNLSEIYGRMEGNGHVFLVNPHGVLIGETGKIDCNGFLATGLNVENQSFLTEGPLSFEEGTGTVINRGQINAGGGKVFLIGADVQNPGVATGDQGVYIQIGNVVVRAKASDLADLENPYALAVKRVERKDAYFVRKEKGRVFLEEEVFSAAPKFGFVDVGPVPFSNGGLYVEETLNSLQQLGSVIPERLWYQRFAIFNKSVADKFPTHALFDDTYPTVSMGASRYYSLQNTVIGDPIRICDDYQEFLDSPYWKTPNGTEQLTNLQNKAKK